VASRLRRVKIVATLGPATSTPERIRGLLQAGVDVVRLNFAHGTRDEHAHLHSVVRQEEAHLGRHVAILQDLAGPKLRTGPLRDSAPVELKDGEVFVLTTRNVPTQPGMASVNYVDLPNDVRPGSTILLDDGNIELRVLTVEGPDVRCSVVNGGLLGAGKGINLPDVGINAPTFTDRDGADLEFGLSLGMDYIALSFVRNPEDIKPARELLRRHRAFVPLLAKIEKPQALARLDGIMRAFDGVMVARGDLGVEIPPEDVPGWQKVIIRKANEAGKPVIIATQMLESMVNSPRPTRAEASDVANAVLDGTDAVMLSGETSIGGYPLEAVSVMVRIIQRAEATKERPPTPHIRRISHARAVSRAAWTLAQNLDVHSVVVLTRSGRTAQLVSADRPENPIVAFTYDKRVARRLALWWGVDPQILAFPGDTEKAIVEMERALLERGLANRGDDIAVVGSMPVASRGLPNFVKLHRLR
jgi:pyruvate kinase